MKQAQLESTFFLIYTFVCIDLIKINQLDFCMARPKPMNHKGGYGSGSGRKNGGKIKKKS